MSTATPPDLTIEQLRAAHIAAVAEFDSLAALLKNMPPEHADALKITIQPTVLLGYISLARARLRDWAMHSYGTDLEAELRAETTATTH